MLLVNSVEIVCTPEEGGVQMLEIPPVASVGVDPMIPTLSKKNAALPAVTPLPVCAPMMVGVPT